ncbi:hypothetical protein PsorP6_013804 [Peronosclerospora sorghi]|uniref:Uncharacterized protein n=1 Tax=Peronosclerospora sorghi TaxID=230839 RepID=A0ACC0VFL3_9STRA|nr:hypothetical protein PsorP6_013804 [Peronosclerospora sorghi]
MEKPFEDKGREEKHAEVNGMIELAQIMESASVADVWMVNASASGEDEVLCERRHLAALELRRSSLFLWVRRLMQGQGPVASRCVQRTLDNALALTSREVHRTMVADLKAKFELPLAYI